MDSLRDIIKELEPNKYIAKTNKNELEKLCNELDKIKYEKIIEGLMEIIKSKKYTKKLKETIEKLVEGLGEDGITQKEVELMVEEAIKEIEDDGLEDKLDEKCERYMKFTESNPAEFISQGKDKSYRLILSNENEIKSKNLKKIVKILKEKKCTEFGKLFSKFCTLKKVEYSGKKIIIYLTEDNKPYFDINHTINLLDDITAKHKKYQEYKNEIALYGIKDNKYGGFYIKEYIGQESFYKILLHSNSLFAKKFKNEIAKILDKLTNQGMITIVDDKVVLIENVKISKECLIEPYEYTQTFDNVKLVNFTRDIIKEFKNVNWNKYLKKHIMYFFIITLDDPKMLNRIMCKIGYSCDLIDRFKGLENTFKCKFYLVGLKLVKNIKDENEFHTMIKKKFPELSVDLRIGNQDRDETYVFDIKLYKTFCNWLDRDEFNSEEIELEKSTELMIQNYLADVEERYELGLDEKTKQNNNKDNLNELDLLNESIEIKKIHYDHLINTQKETNRHIEILMDKEIIMKDKEIIMKDKEIIMKDKEIVLKKCEIEYKKIELEILKMPK